METLVGVKWISNNTVQMIGSTNLNSNIIKADLISMVVKLAEIAEMNHGVPVNEFAHTVPAKIVVYATYMFLSGTDMESFLNDCKNLST
ncbi:MAG TPA: hypothetical protein DCZ30_04340 [Clostridiales bacterium]|nr:hypothetical protein [Clostridiales bacterium]